MDIQGTAGLTKHIQVFDVLGRSVISTVVTDAQKDLNLSEFSRGVYTIRVESEDHVYTQKIILR